MQFNSYKFYNPCKKLEIHLMESIEGQEEKRVIWCGDFNAHNTLWGGDRIDHYGLVVEELMDMKNLYV